MVRGTCRTPRKVRPGLGAQLQELAATLRADRVLIVDGGGDILATGHEVGSRSPLGDSLILQSIMLCRQPCRAIRAHRCLGTVGQISTDADGSLSPAD